jgi:hypothetical protein
MLPFEGIIDKITVCKKLKSFTEEIFKKLSKNLQMWPSFAIGDHTLQDDEIMVF